MPSPIGEDPSVDPGQVSLLGPNDIEIPPLFGSVKERFQQDTDPKGLLIHIQDLHTHYQAHKNIAKIIEYLYKKYGINVVLCEAKETDRGFAYLRPWTIKEVREKVAEENLKEGILTGWEALDLASDMDLVLQGIEEKNLYMKDMESFLKAEMIRPEALKFVDTLGNISDNLKLHVYSRTQKVFDDKLKAYRQEKVGIAEYATYLMELAKANKIDCARFGNLGILLNTLALEKRIDFKKAEAERETVIGILSEGLKEGDLKALLEISMKFKANRISQNEFYKFLAALAGKLKTNMKPYPNFTLYTQYIASYHDLNPSKLFEETNELENTLAEAIFTREDQKRLFSISKNLIILRGLVDFKLTPDEFDYYTRTKAGFDIEDWLKFLKLDSEYFKLSQAVPDDASIIIDNIPILENFYKVARERDEAFVKNIDNQFAKRELKTAFLMTGGFHTPGVTSRLKDAGYSYVVISPRIEEEMDYQRYYERLKESYSKLKETEALAVWHLSEIPNDMLEKIIESGGLNEPIGDDEMRILESRRAIVSVTTDGRALVHPRIAKSDFQLNEFLLLVLNLRRGEAEHKDIERLLVLAEQGREIAYGQRELARAPERPAGPAGEVRTSPTKDYEAKLAGVEPAEFAEAARVVLNEIAGRLETSVQVAKEYSPEKGQLRDYVIISIAKPITHRGEENWPAFLDVAFSNTSVKESPRFEVTIRNERGTQLESYIVGSYERIPELGELALSGLKRLPQWQEWLELARAGRTSPLAAYEAELAKAPELQEASRAILANAILAKRELQLLGPVVTASAEKGVSITFERPLPETKMEVLVQRIPSTPPASRVDVRFGSIATQINEVSTEELVAKTEKAIEGALEMLREQPQWRSWIAARTSPTFISPTPQGFENIMPAALDITERMIITGLTPTITTEIGERSKIITISIPKLDNPDESPTILTIEETIPPAASQVEPEINVKVTPLDKPTSLVGKTTKPEEIWGILRNALGRPELQRLSEMRTSPVTGEKAARGQIPGRSWETRFRVREEISTTVIVREGVVRTSPVLVDERGRATELAAAGILVSPGKAVRVTRKEAVTGERPARFAAPPASAEVLEAVRPLIPTKNIMDTMAVSRVEALERRGAILRELGARVMRIKIDVNAIAETLEPAARREAFIEYFAYMIEAMNIWKIDPTSRVYFDFVGADTELVNEIKGMYYEMANVQANIRYMQLWDEADITPEDKEAAREISISHIESPMTFDNPTFFVENRIFEGDKVNFVDWDRMIMAALRAALGIDIAERVGIEGLRDTIKEDLEDKATNFAILREDLLLLFGLRSDQLDKLTAEHMWRLYSILPRNAEAKIIYAREIGLYIRPIEALSFEELRDMHEMMREVQLSI